MKRSARGQLNTATFRPEQKRAHGRSRSPEILGKEHSAPIASNTRKEYMEKEYQTVHDHVEEPISALLVWCWCLQG